MQIKRTNRVNLIVFAIGLLGLGLLWLQHVPTGVTLNGWHSFILVLFFILGCVLNVAPLATLSLVMVALLGVTGAIPAPTLFSFLGLSPVWLVLFAFFIAIGFKRTPLGKRLAYTLISHFGRTPITLAYTMSLVDLILAPIIPNTNARGAGILFPINKSITDVLDEKSAEPKPTLSSYLTLVTFHQNLVVGGLFLTAMATNPLAVSLANSAFHIQISWAQWFLYASVPTLMALLGIPVIVLKCHRPAVKNMQLIRDTAERELHDLDRMSVKEWLMIGSFVLTVGLWATSAITKLDNTLIALIGLGLLLLFNVISVDDVLNEKQGWNILLWLAPLIGVTEYLNTSGVIKWIQLNLTNLTHGAGLLLAGLILILAYYYIHYFLTSVLVHIQAFFIPFALVLVGLGASPLVTTMLLALLTCVSPATTHYGTGTASIYFSTGFLTQREWWRIGFLVSLFEILVYVVIGLGWWKLLGMY
ncbi:2-oxoglutarate malate translocator [Secundilactobacillus odoratitofui DSM 19909 = JCM 15043]|uniref:2-oxoglutarate malate translocator n=1 Tax=Secundilactobacillus odoratitofui DSM 19909 = JCM 15043 TaxID=1423776 RepID=A0A0R1LVW6_9LACO|nr:DASS family sodium-coupled anion symporter [Secundilactobacillus odoratitofui]KRK97747.1 2-oxoglutarate malate translocator [Secundilactobacillus odoratitofui DSM 19909 = JCM 15043]